MYTWALSITNLENAICGSREVGEFRNINKNKDDHIASCLGK